jgi:hypothetical protein
MVETILGAEIRPLPVTDPPARSGAGVASDEPVERALRQSMADDVERIFRLLTLLYPAADFHSAHVGLRSRTRSSTTTPWVLGNILPTGLRNLLVPPRQRRPPTERARLANRMIGLPIGSNEEAVAALLGSEDAWLKACGAYAVGTLGLRHLQAELDRCLEHPDALLRETASGQTAPRRRPRLVREGRPHRAAG